MKRRIITKPISTHTHLREGKFRVGLVNRAADAFSVCMAMLNTKDGVMTGEEAEMYRNRATAALGTGKSLSIIPIMMANELTTYETVMEARERGILHVKFLPFGKTTNAHYGVKNYARLDHVLGAMEKASRIHPNGPMFAHFHPAHPSPLHDNEEEEYMFLPIFEQLHQRFPGLKMTWEHISDCRVIPALLEMGENVAIGVTAHHPYVTATKVYGRNASGVFKPTAGDNFDREALVRLMTAGHPRVFSGPDDAPHPIEAKSDPNKCTCGADTTEFVTLLHATTFNNAGKLETEEDWVRFERFMTFNACDFYGIPLPIESIVIEEGEFQIPLTYDMNGVTTVPFMAGEKLPFRYASHHHAA